MISDNEVSKLVSRWNSIFGENICMENTYTDVDTLFNNYLQKHNFTDTPLNDEICFCQKIEQEYKITYANNNNIVQEVFNVRSKKKLFNVINNFEIIITEGFALMPDIAPNKIILRYELIRNLYTSNHTHFFDFTMPYSINDMSIFNSMNFYNDIKNNRTRLNTLKFTSFLLNKFEFGITIDDIVLKPKITISPYGRWYWSGTEKVQNDCKVRNKIYDKLIKYGKVMNIDLISGEPTILQKLTNSSMLKKLIKIRTKIHSITTDDTLNSSIKNLMNIYIHSLNSPEIATSIFKKDKNYKEIENLVGLNIYDIYKQLDTDFLEYNQNIIDQYKNNLSVVECNRRIVNPSAIIMSDKEIIKEHRKFLQGHTHDKILRLAQSIYTDTGFLPMFTVHDSISYFINNHNVEEIENTVQRIAKNLRTPVTIDITEKT